MSSLLGHVHRPSLIASMHPPQTEGRNVLAWRRVTEDREAKPPTTPALAIPRSNYLPWIVSAACVMLALFTWIATNPELVRATWSPGPTPSEGATGDIVWSDSQQQGFIRFRGLPDNTPSKEQYQLWIFDRNQSDKTPIDDGVFDVTSTEEVIIPINAKVHVQDAYMFAVTIEKPGGVVVSSRERLPLLAKVD